MRRFLPGLGLCALLLAVASPIAARADDPPKLPGTAAAYAGVPWASVADTVKSALVQRGYRYAQTDSDGDLVFTGKSGPITVDLIEALDPSHKLVKSLIVIHPAEDVAIETFKSLSKALSDEYGAPSAAYEDYGPSHPTADKDKRAAIAAGDATLATFWFYADGSSIYVQLTKALTIEADYESPRWSAESARRKAARSAPAKQ